MKPLLWIIFLLLWLGKAGQAQNHENGFRYDTIYRTHKTVVQKNPVSHKTTYKQVKSRRDRWRLGGSFGMAFGDQTTLNIAPQIAYRPSPYVSFGGGVNYSYYHSSHRGNTYRMNYMGLDLFVRMNPLPFLSFQVQPEVLQRWGKHNGEEVKGRVLPVFLVGGGFTIPSGPRGHVNIMFYYDLIQSKYTPYGSNLYYTVGYSFQF